jgi:hypothetical protein
LVDLALLQSVSYIAGALGVCVAAFYYVMNLRISQRNQALMLKSQELTLETRRIDMLESIGTRISSEDGMKRFYELMSYEWKDYADYNSKYGSENNLEATAKRTAQWNSYNRMGMLLRKGFVDVGELYDMGYPGVVYFWEKYKLIVEESRRRYTGKDYCNGMEYLAGEMLKHMQLRDPSFRVPETFLKYDPDK